MVKQEDIRAQYVESNSLLAINEINNGPFNSFHWLSIVLDILSLKIVCGVRYFSFIPRAVNEHAYNIATAHNVQDIDFYFWWFDELSPTLCNRFYFMSKRVGV